LLRSTNNLAIVLRRQGKCEQAEEIHGQVLGLMETTLGKEHLDTLMSMDNQGNVLIDQACISRRKRCIGKHLY